MKNFLSRVGEFLAGFIIVLGIIWLLKDIRVDIVQFLGLLICICGVWVALCAIYHSLN